MKIRKSNISGYNLYPKSNRSFSDDALTNSLSPLGFVLAQFLRSHPPARAKIPEASKNKEAKLNKKKKNNVECGGLFFSSI